MNSPSIVALLTDFGHKDVYVGVMKGVMLSINRDIRFIDLCHECPPGSIREAAFLLYSAWGHLPADTVVLSVVDPGVGSSRREIIVEADGITHIGPDNGTISLVSRFHPISESHRADPGILKELSRSQSTTFHGRDLFAPIAAELASGNMILGEECSPVVIDQLNDHADGGVILHIDGFGNLITSFHIGDFDSIESIEALIVTTKHGQTRFDRTGAYFGEVKTGEPIIYVGSTGFVEIAARDANAAQIWSVEVDDHLELDKRI